MPDRHLLGVWNPSYAADAMDAHLRVLLANIAAWRDGGIAGGGVYVCLGQGALAQRMERLPHLDEILAMDATLEAEGDRELHLYLTDYRSLYVGHVYEITTDDVRADEGSHVPDYYSKRDLQCDCWFRLGDIRRLVLDDTVAVIAELRKLRNTHYDDRPVSLYGGMVTFRSWSPEVTANVSSTPSSGTGCWRGSHWAEADAARTGLGAIERDLRENLFGAQAWNALDLADPDVHRDSEQVFGTHRADAGFDFAAVVIDLAKALEVQANLVVRRGLAGAPVERRRANVDGATRDLAEGPPLSWASSAACSRRSGPWLRRSRCGSATATGWCGRRRTCPGHGPRSEPGGDTEPVSRADAERLHNELLGIGCFGDLVRLADVSRSRSARSSPLFPAETHTTCFADGGFGHASLK